MIVVAIVGSFAAVDGIAMILSNSSRPMSRV